jgi:hypothetical protein
MPMTITEGLAEIKTISKRLDTKKASVIQYLARQANLKDPLEKDGGSVEFIAREFQAYNDLNERIIAIRKGIAAANDATNITIRDKTRTISEWLTWRRDVMPAERVILNQMRMVLQNIRQQAQRGGVAVVSVVNADKEPAATDWIVNISEKDLAEDIEALDETEGALDGQLSLKNATVLINGV